MGWTLAVLGGTIAYYFYVLVGADRDIWPRTGTAFAVQMFAFAAALLMLGFGRDWAIPRPSDPGLIFLFWAACYYIYPSGAWIRGGKTLLADFLLQDGNGALLAHAVFMLSFMGTMLLVSGRGFWKAPRISVGRLPKVGFLLAFPIAVLVGIALVRFTATGQLTASSDYGGQWADMASGVRTARSSGGISYLLTQIVYRFAFLPILALGAFGGIVGAKAFVAKRGRVLWLLLMFGVVVLTLVLGVAPRSGALMVLIIAVFTVDLLTGLMKWRYVLPILFVVMYLFVFFQFFREISDEGLGNAVKHSTSQVDKKGEEQLDEFTLMLGKEVVAGRYFPSHSEGAMLVVQDALTLIPSQLLPEELGRLDTATILSIEILGVNAVQQGQGVSSSTIAHGYRLGWGLWGVGIMAALMAAILGSFVRWMIGWKGERPDLLRVVYCAGYLAWGFIFIRGDLLVIVSVTFYNLVVPWFATRVFLASIDERTADPWRDPMPAD